jgi:Flp pilus assembly protein TadD
VTSTTRPEPKEDEQALDAMSDVELYEAGSAHFEAGDSTLALAHLSQAFGRNPNSARVRSLYGLCLGLSERRFEESRSLCESAAKQEFFNPDLYFNLALLHLGFGFRAEAVRYLRRGLMIDPRNKRLEGALRQLGDRSRPVIGFLPRSHPFNRWLGAARYQIVRHTGFGMAA